jgi:TonB family protein
VRSLLLGVGLATALLSRAAVAQEGEGDEDPADDEQGGEVQYDDKGRPIPKPKGPAPKQKVTLPKLKKYAPADYPEEAAEQGIEGEVILRVTIDVDGKVVKAEVHTPGGHGFDEAALAAAPGLLFDPARREDGTPFQATIKFRYRFELDEPEPEPEPVAAVPVGALHGQVLDAGSDQPIADATVTISREEGEAPEPATTDARGAFRFGDLPAGSYRVTISAPGYDDLVLTETVNEREELDATYRLTQPAPPDVVEVFVEGEKPPREVTRRTIEKREIERIPGTGGDALKSILSLPGVARPPAIAGILLVRGSAPQDTQTFVDGVFVPLIYHFGGLSSVVPTELLSKIDFYPGNFSARYGRVMGGIVDVGIRSPRDDGFHGMVQLDLIDARALVEGPIPFTDGKWTFAAAGRRSYLDAWLGPVLEEAGAGVTQAPRYYDYQFMVERKWDTGKLRGSFYGSDDGLEILIGEPAPGEPALAGNLGFSTAFQRGQVGYTHDWTESQSFEAQLAFAHDAITLSLSNLFFDLDSLAFIGRLEHTTKLAQSATMHIGLDLFGGRSLVSARIPAPGRPGQPQNQPFSTRQVVTVDQTNPFFRPAAYLEMELTPISRWQIVPGFRLDYALDNDGVDASPRLNSRFDIVEEFPRTTLKGGVGAYHQPPQFQESLPPFGDPTVKSNLAIHYGLGVEQEITEQLEVSLEGFYKQLDNLVVASPSASGSFSTYANTGLGNVVGGELLLKYKADEHFFGWLAYTLSRSVRQDSPTDAEFPVLWDQTHVLTLLGSYRFGGGWEVGLRFRLASGNLFSPTVCDATSESCDPTRVNALYHGATGAYTPIRIGELNNERLPTFHALDLRVDKAWQFKLWKFSMYLDVQNVYNSSSAEGVTTNFDFTARQYISGIPILPSLGFRGEW